MTAENRGSVWRRENPERAKEIRRKSYAKRREEDPLVAIRHNLCHARARCLSRGIPFDLTVEQLPAIPSVCPALGIPLTRAGGKNSPNLPEMDRLVPALGYVAGNIRWISRRANTIKNSATADEIIQVALWLEEELEGA